MLGLDVLRRAAASISGQPPVAPCVSAAAGPALRGRSWPPPRGRLRPVRRPRAAGHRPVLPPSRGWSPPGPAVLARLVTARFCRPRAAGRARSRAAHVRPLTPHRGPLGQRPAAFTRRRNRPRPPSQPVPAPCRGGSHREDYLCEFMEVDRPARQFPRRYPNLFSESVDLLRGPPISASARRFGPDHGHPAYSGTKTSN
jgi:hypothetical protein